MMKVDINFRERIQEKLIESYQARLLYWTGDRQVGSLQTVEFIGNQAYEHVRELCRLHELAIAFIFDSEAVSPTMEFSKLIGILGGFDA